MQDFDSDHWGQKASRPAVSLRDDPSAYYSHFLFDTLHSAVLYLDKWGRIRSANAQAKQLFEYDNLIGKTILEVLKNWDDPVMVYQEILSVARTGHSVVEQTEKVTFGNDERWLLTDKIAVKNESHGFAGVVFTLDDITELKQQEINLAKSEGNYRAFVENSDDAIWRLDLNPPVDITTSAEQQIQAILDRAVIGHCNDVFYELYQINNEQRFEGSLFKSLSFNEQILDVKQLVASQFQLSKREMQFTRPDGEPIYTKCSTQGIVQEDSLISIWGVARDTTERQRYIEQLEYQTTHDVLTGLPNRHYLNQLVNQALTDCEASHQVALMIIDLDSFKEINDTLGHDIGDYIIQAIGPRINQQLTNTPSSVARLGGDEFAILLTELENQEQAENIAHRILDGIRQYFHIGDIDVELRASIGISLYPNQAKNFSTLMRYADVAMYCAKKDMSGVVIYNAENDAHSPKRLSLMSELGKAIRNDDLCLHFQPKISLSSQSVVGVEALSRWIHPSMGMISPAEFVPIAEMTDLINDMTSWVLQKSLQQVNQWRSQGLTMKVAVNISSRNLLQPHFCEQIECLLAQYNLPATCLELEITESTIMHNTEQVLQVLKRLNELGVELSIDDFGTGYSSLAYLKRLPVKWLKIDYSFIINMMQSEQDQIIVNSTINMAHNLGLLVVAEGVENQDTMKRLSSMQCEQAQGFHIAKPMPSEEVYGWCKHYESAA